MSGIAGKKIKYSIKPSPWPRALPEWSPSLDCVKPMMAWALPYTYLFGEEQTREHYCNPTLSMSKLTTRFPRRPVGPTREGRTMLSLYSRVGFRWNAVGGGCGGRPVSANTGGRCSRWTRWNPPPTMVPKYVSVSGTQPSSEKNKPREA